MVVIGAHNGRLLMRRQLRRLVLLEVYCTVVVVEVVMTWQRRRVLVVRVVAGWCRRHGRRLKTAVRSTARHGGGGR